MPGAEVAIWNNGSSAIASMIGGYWHRNFKAYFQVSSADHEGNYKSSYLDVRLIITRHIHA
jgi:hypothetical protein